MHVYEEKDGVIIPRHFVKMKVRDDIRPTRITDYRKWKREGLNVAPSVTTILDVMGKDALVNWKIDQHLEQARKLGDYGSNVDFDKYSREVKRLTQIELDKIPKPGTDFHELMEAHVLRLQGGERVDTKRTNAERELCDKVVRLIEQKIDQSCCSWETEVNFINNEYGYGGQVDLIPIGWNIDYKTKATADKFKPGKMAYDNHSMQLAAYRKTVSPNARCANVFVCLEDGQIDFHEHSEEELIRGWEMFQHCLELWYLKNRIAS